MMFGESPLAHLSRWALRRVDLSLSPLIISGVTSLMICLRKI
jgi:hypothetical protein